MLSKNIRTEIDKYDFLRVFINFFVVILVIYFAFFSTRVVALENCTEARLRDLKVQVLNCKGDTELGCDTVAVGASIRPGSKIYMLGDSITSGASYNLTSQITAAGFSLTINADPGRAITTDTAGSEPPGLQAIANDLSTVATSDAIVIALGTNSGGEDLNAQIPALITAIRSTGFKGKLFWVNLFYTANGGPSERNSIIATQGVFQNYTVIDTSSANIEMQSDNIHPTVAGNITFAEVVTNALKASSSTSNLPSGAYDPISLAFPNFPDKTATATALTNYIRENKPSSPWLGINNGDIGGWLFRESETRNINPLLIAAIGKQENNFGTSSQVHVQSYYNYFGMKGSGPVTVPGSDYRGFSSPEAGIIFFMDAVKNNTQGTDRRLYAEVMNFYDYLGMHQAGQIKYPGEPLGNQGPTGQDGFDPSMRVYVSWTTSDHPNDRYDGQVFNPGIYYTNSINFINELTGSSLSTVPTRGPTSASAGANCDQDGFVSTNGYAFPLAPQKKQSYSTLPCAELTCHHDGTPAFDLSYAGVAGQSVYAIIGGRIDKINTQEEGFCQSIQLEGSDGFYYWYGHLIGVSVAEGTTVVAGQEIAKVADWTEEHTCNGTSGGDHLHIDRGCTLNGIRQRGGTDACRDPDFIPFMNALYESLPG